MKSPHCLLAALLLVTACPSSDDGGGGSGGTGGAGTQPSTAACDQTALLYCRRYFACFPDGAQQVYGSEQACAADDAMACRVIANLPDVEKMSVDHWAACNRALAMLTCEAFDGALATEQACQPIPGVRPTGQSCVASGQCSSGFCKVPPGPDSAGPDDLAVCGTCTPAPAEGDACTEWYECGDLSCSGGKCTKPQGEGSPCADSVGCKGSLVCIDSKCAQPRQAGEPCTDIECANELRCVDGKCGPGVPDGQTCAEYYQCESWDCGLDGTCAKAAPPPTVLQPGARCGDPGTECRVDGYCEATTHLCTLYKRQGEPCTGNHQCAYWLSCQSGKCQPFNDGLCR